MSGTGKGIVGLGREGTYRHVLLGSRHMVSAAHFAAAHAGFLVLEAGGNAIDAGVAAGFMLGVVQSDIVNVAGVAPIMLYLAESREVVTIDGLGVWPRAASIEHFEREHGGQIPEGLLRTVTPAAPAAWLAALERYGTMSFGEVAAAAIRLAREGFPMHPPMADYIARNEPRYARWPQNAAIYLPRGRAPASGEIFVQSDLAASLQYMADEEKAAKRRGRVAGIQAARDAFYRGDIAKRIAAYHRAHGGWLTEEDLAEYQVRFEPPARCRFGEVELYTCGPWCQGPVLAETLNILDGVDLAALGHNSPAYVHMLTEAIKLAFADREAYFGDPRFVDVPLEVLLSQRYAAQRRAEIDPKRAAPGMPPAGRAWPDQPAPRLELAAAADAAAEVPRTAHDTSYVAVIDRHGNVFSATPSDSSSDGEVIPGTGLCPSTRGCQSRTEPGPSERARTRQAPAPHAQSRDRLLRRARGDALRHAGRRRAEPGDAASAAQRRGLRHGPSGRGQRAALCQPQLPEFVCAARLLSRPSHARRRACPRRPRARSRHSATRCSHGPNSRGTRERCAQSPGTMQAAS